MEPLNLNRVIASHLYKKYKDQLIIEHHKICLNVIETIKNTIKESIGEDEEIDENPTSIQGENDPNKDDTNLAGGEEIEGDPKTTETPKSTLSESLDRLTTGYETVRWLEPIVSKIVKNFFKNEIKDYEEELETLKENLKPNDNIRISKIIEYIMLELFYYNLENHKEDIDTIIENV